MDDRTYRRMAWGCRCGHVARSAIEEARHRHAFPMFCLRPRQKFVFHHSRSGRQVTVWARDMTAATRSAVNILVRRAGMDSITASTGLSCTVTEEPK